jgi:folate-binding protein YgfZ
MFWCEYPRDAVEMHGPDAASYLQSQLSQDISRLEVGGSAWTFLLQPTGKLDVLARVWRVEDERFVLDTDAGFGEALAARLARFKIRVKADIVPLSWRCIAVRGEGPVPDGALASWGVGYDLLAESPQPPAGVDEGDETRLLAARIDAGWPQMGTEIVPGETIPAETGVSDVAVSFTKGCYPGQELVERMDSRGAAAPRAVRRVEVAEGTRAGDAYVVDGTEVGRVTSVHGTAALALVKRSALTH